MTVEPVAIVTPNNPPTSEGRGRRDRLAIRVPPFVPSNQPSRPVEPSAAVRVTGLDREAECYASVVASWIAEVGASTMSSVTTALSPTLFCTRK